MPIYKGKRKKNGLQEYRVIVNYTNSDGEHKPIERTAYGYDNAKQLEASLSANLKEAKIKKITVSELIAEYLIFKKYEIRETSLDKTKRRIKLYIEPYLGKKRIDKLNVPAFRQWKMDIEEYRTKNNQPLALGTKNGIYCELRALINYAVEMEYIPKNNLIKAGRFIDPYEETEQIDFYTADEFLQYIDVAKKRAEEAEEKRNIHEWNYYVFFMIAFYTGMRKGEINALNWNDWDDDIIHVTKSVSQKLKGKDRKTPPKRPSSNRDLEIPNQLKECLSEHLNRYQNVRGFNPTWHICGGIRCIRDTTIENRNADNAEAAQLKHIRIHDFRHSHASYLVHCNVNIKEVARRLGHKKVELAWNRYSHLYPSDRGKAVEVLNEIGKSTNQE